MFAHESPAFADEPDEKGPITPPVELRHNPVLDVAAIAALGGSTLGVALVRGSLQPSECRWCDGPKPTGVNAVDDWFRTALRRPDTQPAKVLSDVLAYGAAPVAGAGLTVLAACVDRRSEGSVTDVTLIAEGTLAAVLTTEVLKPFVLRERPYVHAIADPEAHAAALSEANALQSFPSGHTTMAFAVAASSGVVATMRGYRLAPLVWATGLFLGVATAYGRMAADAHYFTDTLAGATIGTVVGGGVPLLFHRPRARRPKAFDWLERATPMTTAIPGGRVVGVGFTL
jgi:membrane-associated phospholipid phosphatase